MRRAAASARGAGCAFFQASRTKTPPANARGNKPASAQDREARASEQKAKKRKTRRAFSRALESVIGLPHGTVPGSMAATVRMRTARRFARSFGQLGARWQ